MVGDIERVLDALQRAGVRFLVVGGVAVALHGHLRTTADLDLVLRLDRKNVLLALEVLGGLGYRPRAPVALESFADPSERDRWIRETGMLVFSLWDPGGSPLEVDLFAESSFDFEAAHARGVRVRLNTVEAPVVGLDDLLAMKRRGGRPRDSEDLEALEAIQRKRGDAASRG